MLISTLPDCKAFTVARGALRGARLLLPLLFLALSLAPPAQAQAAGAQRAIEKLENCSKQERKSGCIAILKVERGSGDKQAIKAQVRGGRIIWYEYDRKSGRVRRTN
jgi:hypothetical protein